MALILNIETSATICSVCLAENGKVIREINASEPNQHTKIITTQIEQLFQETNKTYAQLDAVALSSGPGSYTGLRIGASVAKGLCFALDKPLIAVSTLHALAWQMRTLFLTDKKIYFLLPVIAARKGAFYCALYNENLEIIERQVYCSDTRNIPFPIIPEQTFTAFFPAKLQISDISNTFGTEINNVNPSANNLVSLSFEKFRKEDFENIALYEPDYITGFGKTL